MAEPTSTTFKFVLRLLCVALMASLMIVLVAVTAILLQRSAARPPIWPFAVVAAVLVLEKVLISRLGYRFEPIAPGTDEESAKVSSIKQIQRSTIIKFALAEAVALVAIALAFVVNDGGVYVSAAGVVAAEIVIFANLWPREPLIARIQSALERDGGLSYLREALDAPPPSRRA
jgi:hypothetical protein